MKNKKSILPAQNPNADLTESVQRKLNYDKADRVLKQLKLKHVVFSFGAVPDPEDLAIEGSFEIYEEHDSFWGSGKDYRKEFVNPTWGELFRAADECIKTTGDQHHVFLEDIQLEGSRLVLCFGS